jgi:hypothetical protein
VSDKIPSAKKIVRLFILFWWLAVLTVSGLLVYQTDKAWVKFQTTFGRALHVTEDPIVRYDPTLGWKQIPGKHIEKLSASIGPVAINNNGFRAGTDYSFEKPTNKFRIIALGDSFTFGMVKNEDTWPVQLEALDPSLQVINMGACAYGVDQMYLWFKQDGVSFDTDLVIMSVIPADLERAYMYKWLTGHGRPHFILENDQLKLTNVPVPPRIEPGQRNVHPIDFVNFLRAQFFPVKPDPGQELVPFRIIQEQKNLVESQHHRFILLILPELLDIASDRKMRLKLRAWSDEIGIEYLDLTDIFRTTLTKEPANLYYQTDKHYTGTADRLVATEVERYLHTNRLIDR